MASLKFIMDANDDLDLPVDTRTNTPIQKDKDSGTPANTRAQEPSLVISSSPSHANVSSSGPAIERNHIRPAGPAPHTQTQPQGRRRGQSTRGSKSTSATTSSTSPPSTRPRTRRRSTASNDSMDHTGYGSTASSSSIGGGMNPQVNRPMRPMPPNSASDLPHRLTPVTGRVSRAKKGIPVHVCEICKPPKTFTRAEHLRRHQLSHQTPGYPCTSPGCDRAFHRPDLLLRHQQRHEQEGDKVSKSGGEEDGRRTSSASQMSSSVEERFPNLALRQPSSSSTGILPGPMTASTPSRSATEMPATPNLPPSQAGFQLHSPGHASTSPTPHQIGGGGGSASDYRRASQEYAGYTLSPTVSVIHPHPAHTSPPMAGSSFAGLESYQQPRTAAPSIYVVTQGRSLPSLQIPESGPPDLYHTHDASPWASSASDSTYSTPASDISRTRGYWLSRHRSPTAEWQSTQLLSPYPNTTPRDLQSPGLDNLAVASAPMFIDPFSTSPQFTTPHTFGGPMLDVQMTGFPSADPGNMISPSSESTFRAHHHHTSSVPSVRSPTPPPNTSSHTSENLVAPLPALPTRIDALVSLGRQKEMAMDLGGVAHPALMSDGGGVGLGMGVLGGPGSGGGGFGGDASPSSNDNNSGTLAALDLSMSGCGIPGVALTIPLPRPVRAAIPSYLDVYWAKVHPLFPIVHRRSLEAASEDVLRCAMAAVATQYLDSKEDRVRGNQLHEYAWQEAKRTPQWNLQIMQAILLCEYFARFRGRKAATRPSKLFDSLYSRVLYHNPAMFDPAVLNPTSSTSSAEERWQIWLDAEARRRLLTACFVVDAHTSIYQQQRRAQDCDVNSVGTTPPIPLAGHSAALWEASSANEWAALLAADPEAGTPKFVPQSDAIRPEEMQARSPFDHAAMLCVEILRLPRRGSQGTPTALDQFHHPEMSHLHSSLNIDAEVRVCTLFPNCPTASTYLALHHTPLHDLLAVSGDSWVFSQKVLPATSFLEHQKRLKLWAEQYGGNYNTGSSRGAAVSSNSISAAKATIYASRAIVGFLSRLPNNHGPTAAGNAPSPAWRCDISDYWGLYVCALICWAYCHRARPAGSRTASSSAVLSSAATFPGLTATGMHISPAVQADEEALAWLRSVAEQCSDSGVARVRARREAGGVVGLVRRRLEADCVGARSRLYVDAVGVLKKLEEGVNWKWF